MNSRAWQGRKLQFKPLAGVIWVTVFGILPVYLVGGLGAYIQAELGMRAAGLGASVSVFFGASAMLSSPAGWVTENRDAWKVLRLAIILSATSLAGLAALASSWLTLACFLALAGGANALVHPAANQAIARFTVQAHHGVSLGAKQAAIPAASLAAGLAIPLLAATIGWRWAFVTAAALGSAVFLLLPPPGSIVSKSRRTTGRRRVSA